MNVPQKRAIWYAYQSQKNETARRMIEEAKAKGVEVLPSKYPEVTIRRIKKALLNLNREETETAMAAEAEVGSFIKYAGIEWVVLNRTASKVMVLAKHRLFNRAFDTDESNNWANSSLRKELNNFNKRGFQRGFENTENINKKDLVEFERDLTTDDGIADYGKCKDYISLISCGEYRKFRKFIPNADDWWWTLTGDSLVYSYDVRFVRSNGTLHYNSAYFGNFGVRPLCVLKSDTEVELCEKV